MNRYLNNNNPSDCCGCSACVQRCPKSCLAMGVDKDGFLFPKVIDGNACVDCGLCAKVCPLENEVDKVQYQSFYGAYNNNLEDIRKSSSGGIYPALSKWFIKQGGIVYGSMLETASRDLYHVGVTDIDGLDKTLGSKYYQSEIRDSYKECKSSLDKGLLVLFTGTPCQIQGLKCFLKKEYKNLFTADVICHGVPSGMMFKAYVRYLEKKHRAKLVDINFRDKEKYGWSITLRYTMEFFDGKRKDYYLERWYSEYFMDFLGGYIARESCYSCPFSSLDRPGDITMGDFWGYQYKRPDLRHPEGLSLIISNSKKGEYLINLLESQEVHFDLVDEECVRASENKNLYQPTRRPIERDEIYNELESRGFKYIAEKYFVKRQPLINRLKKRLYKAIKKS